MASLGKMIKISFPSLLLSLSLFVLLVDLVNGGPLFPCDPTKGMASFAFCDTTLPIDQRARDLVGRLTLQEKAQQLISRASAVPRLGVPAYQWWSEALHGVSDLGPGTKFGGPVPAATMFPIPLHSAASFNASLWLSIGRAVSTEARGMYNVGFAGLTFWSPTMNVVRDPRWGRTQETPGEDPLLVGKYAVNYVRGLQDAGVTDPDRLKVAACCKHYTAYDLDNWKNFNRYTFNAKVTEQDLEDTYNPPFKSCVLDGNVASVMCSYNQVNGVPTCADRNLLAGTIRDKWNLNGYIVSDCDSLQVLYNNQKYTNTPEQAAAVALNAGLDLNCDNFLARHTEAAVNTGLVNESRVDDALVNNFKVLMRLGWFNGDPAKQPFGNLGATDVCSAEHQELALEAARQGVVLLKNLNKALPLVPSLTPTVAVIGPNANVTKTMIGNYAGKACRYTTPLQGISSYVKTVYAPGCANVLCADNSLIGAAAQAAGSADATVLIMGADQTVEKESLDRVSFLLPGHQQDLVTAVTQASKGPVILFIMSGGPFDISFAKDDEKIVGIFWAGYPGQAGGQAMADVIFGAYSPGGKLPVSWYPEEYTNIPMTDMNMRPNPATGYPGRTYRFYTGKTVYKFGDGLSYTSFNHTMARAPTVVSMAMYGKRSCLRTEGKVCEAVRVTHAMCADMFMDVHVDVHNVGSTDSGHVLMLFSSPPSARRRPRKQLLGFRRIHVAAGSTERVHFTLDVCKDLSVADRKGFRKLPVGSHLLHVGGIKHSFDLQINA